MKKITAIACFIAALVTARAAVADEYEEPGFEFEMLELEEDEEATSVEGEVADALIDLYGDCVDERMTQCHVDPRPPISEECLDVLGFIDPCDLIGCFPGPDGYPPGSPWDKIIREILESIGW